MNKKITIEYRFPLPNGLHARPASAIMEQVKPLGCSVHITNLRNQKTANASSVLSMISCDIALGDQCLISIEGDSDNLPGVAQQLQQFLNGDFYHCDEVLTELTATDDKKPLPYMLQQEPMRRCQGLSVSPGFGTGKAMHLGEPVLVLSADSVAQGSIEEEHQRLAQVREQLLAVLKQEVQRSDGQQQAIVRAHLALLEDQELVSHLTQGLRAGLSVLGAVLATQQHYEQVISGTSNHYLRERVLDIRDICSGLIITAYGPDSFEATEQNLTEDTVCIASHLTPSQFLALDRSYLQGLVLESGGSTSHTVILARSFGIPVLVGVEQARQQIPAGETCILDASNSLLIANPSPLVCRYYQLEQDKLARLSARRQRYLNDQAQTTDGHFIEVAANIASAEEAASAFANGAEGIGLFRTEMLYMDRTGAPDEEEQLAMYSQVLQCAGDRPVIIRTMDIGGDKPVDYFGIGAEENPFLGYRAVRIYPEYLDHFKTQLRAICRAAVNGQCKIMVPMVATLAEARWLRAISNEVIAELTEQQIAHNPNVPLGIMLEVPSCAFIIDQLVRYVDFFSIGSNDLTQYFLAADRGNDGVEHLYDSLNPSFLRLLKHIVDEVHKAGSWVGICGEFAGDPDHMPLLVGLQLDEISLGAPRIPEVKEVISTLNTEVCKALLVQAMAEETADDVRILLARHRQVSADDLPILTSETILVNADCRNKSEVIKTLIDNLLVNDRLLDVQEAETAIWEREGMSPTMLGFGIAIPHCKSNSIAANTISIMKLKEPVLWNEGDEMLTDTVFMLTVRASDAGNTHMKIFAQLARRIMRDEFRTALATCQGQQELMSYISQELEL